MEGNFFRGGGEFFWGKMGLDGDTKLNHCRPLLNFSQLLKHNSRTLNHLLFRSWVGGGGRYYDETHRFFQIDLFRPKLTYSNQSVYVKFGWCQMCFQIINLSLLKVKEEKNKKIL